MVSMSWVDFDLERSTLLGMCSAPGTKKDTGSAIRPKNSRLVAPPGFMLHEAADFSALDVPIFYNLGSYDSPESPLSM